ncbi:hypothetical protein MY5147_004922 [Beauveria neobassiana]
MAATAAATYGHNDNATRHQHEDDDDDDDDEHDTRLRWGSLTLYKLRDSIIRGPALSKL